MKNSEANLCRDVGIKCVAFTVANDGLTIVVNQQNTWATASRGRAEEDLGARLEGQQLEGRPLGLPGRALKLFGPGTDSGTFDFFTEAINGRARASRSDYQASEDDNVLVQGVSGERGGMGYFGFSYYKENPRKLKIVKVDKRQRLRHPEHRDGPEQHVQAALAAALHLREGVARSSGPRWPAFIDYIFDNEMAIAKKAGFIALTDRQLKKARYQYLQALKSNN